MNAIEPATHRPNIAPPPPAARPNGSTQERRRRLHELPSGAHGIVHSVATSDSALLRLMAMGLCVGREIEVVQRGNPLILRLLGARIGVSERLAEQILIERCNCSQCCGEKAKAQTE